MSRTLERGGVAALCLSFLPISTWACATCGCTVNSDAAMGYAAGPGWRVNLEYTYIDQDQLRIGTRTATPGEVVNSPSNPVLDGGEIEKDTINRYLTLGVNYRPDANWSVNLLVPYVIRGHTTYGTQQQPYSTAETAPGQISGARVSKLGDVKLLGNYQGLLSNHDFGLQLGVKLPTGQYGTAVNFDNGPNTGSPLDASLQAGTGSTDLIVGAYYYRAVAQDVAIFANGQFQSAVAHKQSQPGNDFKPGNSETLSLGVRYEANPNWIPQLQLNVLHKSPDQGALADTTDTIGTVAFISPGITIQVLRNLHAYGVAQLPVYSNLDGYQLFPHWTATVGVSYSL